MLTSALGWDDRTLGLGCMRTGLFSMHPVPSLRYSSTAALDLGHCRSFKQHRSVSLMNEIVLYRVL